MSDQATDLLAAIEELDARIKELEEALKPFAKAGELFPEPAPYGPALIYGPAAGADYEIHSDHLRAASKVLKFCNPKRKSGG